MRGADDGKGKLLSQVGDKIEVSIDLPNERTECTHGRRKKLRSIRFDLYVAAPDLLP